MFHVEHFLHSHYLDLSRTPIVPRGTITSNLPLQNHPLQNQIVPRGTFFLAAPQLWVPYPLAPFAKGRGIPKRPPSSARPIGYPPGHSRVACQTLPSAPIPAFNHQAPTHWATKHPTPKMFHVEHSYPPRPSPTHRNGPPRNIPNRARPVKHRPCARRFFTQNQIVPRGTIFSPPQTRLHRPSRSKTQIVPRGTFPICYAKPHRHG